MNMAGNIAGFVSPAVFAYILRWSGDNWIFTFYVSAAIYFIGAVSWLFIDPVTAGPGRSGRKCVARCPALREFQTSTRQPSSVVVRKVH